MYNFSCFPDGITRSDRTARRRHSCSWRPNPRCRQAPVIIIVIVGFIISIIVLVRFLFVVRVSIVIARVLGLLFMIKSFLHVFPFIIRVFLYILRCLIVSIFFRLGRVYLLFLLFFIFLLSHSHTMLLIRTPDTAVLLNVIMEYIPGG
jgi:hypothetical protein